MREGAAISKFTARPEAPQELLMRGQELVRFLRFHREQQWSDWLEARLESIRAREPGAVRRLLDGFTGIANISDVFLCREAGHRVTRASECGVNEQYLIMVSKLYQLARNARDDNAG